MNIEKVIKGLIELKRFLPSTMWEPIDDAIAMLNAQKGVEPTTDEYGNKRCGNCGYKLQSIMNQDLFCCVCGKPVKW